MALAPTQRAIGGRVNTPGTYPPGQYPPPGGFPAASLTSLQGAPVGFGEAIRQAGRNGFAYRGRAYRGRTGGSFLFQGVVFAVVAIASIPLAGNKGASLAIAIISLPLLYLEMATFALWVRRLHDTGRSGWWILFLIVP
jgi:hypothetical protein